MVLDDEQNELFFDVMDALLYYVNDRFRVVEGFTLEYASPLDDVRSSLVAHALWDNVEIIDEFVAKNPYGLPRRALDIAASWKYALPDFYTLVRYQGGRALLMSEAGVFSVSGVTYPLEEEIGQAPAYVDMVLLPFEGLVVYDGFLQAYDVESQPASAQVIQDEFENRCAKGIVSNGREFVNRASQYLAQQRDKELDALLADVVSSADHGEEELPRGFHRGALAGLSPDERRQTVETHFSETAQNAPVYAYEYDRRTRKREPVHSLEDCLSLTTKPQLIGLAQAMGMGSLDKLKKPEVVTELAAELVANPQLLVARLGMTDDESYAFARRVAAEGELTFPLAARSENLDAWPLEPYVYLFRGKGSYAAIVPDELRPLMAAADFGAIDGMRRQQKQAVACAEACAVYCGVAAMDDVYDQYRALVSDVVGRPEFAQLVEIEAMRGNAGFGIWHYEPHDYIVHYTLTPEFLAEEIARSQRGAIGQLMRNGETGAFSIQGFVERMRSDLAAELESLEQYKRDLVETQKALPMRPLSRSILENDVYNELLDLESVVRLRAFLDAHVPNGEDDYRFADEVAGLVVMGALESGSLQQIYGRLLDVGLGQLADDGSQLTLLTTNAFNAMPSWENNGWSPQELYEQVTGRKVFYNEDGTVMRVGAGDPCPCGSGKKYRDCCGR